MTMLTFLFRRLLLPTCIATLASRFVFTLFQEGSADLSDMFVGTEDAYYTFIMVFVVLLCMTGVAYVLDRSRAPTWLRVPLLLGVAAESGFLLVLFLTEVVAYAELAYAPATAAGIVWMLCNLDLMKRGAKLSSSPSDGPSAGASSI
ncbi:MAG: hypothetical protein Q27BB25_17375 [Blastomonas sp. CACIA14H2]|uniref:hypothetical protein n=1 Tax=Blastomonas sp. CACIA14H2 TaxID=1419876 RepID=UPI0003D04C86|nr:MAG: hypothetical protein Q27BB25_17375 [Blastomonas sp. CACIA14H2]